MFNLRQFVKDRLDQLDMTQKELAEQIGYTSLSKFLNNDKTEKGDKNKEFKNFEALVKMIRILSPDEEFEIMEKYCRTLECNNKLVISALEHASFNKLHSLLDHLIENMMDSSNKEWALIYSIDKQVSESNIKPSEISSEINRLRLKQFESITFSKIVQSYGYFDLKCYDMIAQSIDEIKILIDSVKDEYLRKSYTVRVSLIMMDINFHKNNLDIVRHYGELTLANSAIPCTHAMTYHYLAHSYTFENYEKSLNYLRLALEIYETASYILKATEVKRSINFLQNLWDKHPEFLDCESHEPQDVHERIFSYVNKGQYIEAKRLLDEINVDNLSEFRKGFHFFYKGKLHKDKSYFRMSVYHFKNTGELFYRKISLLELERLGEDPTTLLAFSN